MFFERRSQGMDVMADDHASGVFLPRRWGFLLSLQLKTHTVIFPVTHPVNICGKYLR